MEFILKLVGSIHGPGTPSVRMATCTSCTPTTPELPPASDTPRVAESQVGDCLAEVAVQLEEASKLATPPRKENPRLLGVAFSPFLTKRLLYRKISKKTRC